MSDLNTEVQLLKKEVSDMKMIYSRLDKAIEKISDVSNSINRMLGCPRRKDKSTRGSTNSHRTRNQ